MKYFSPKKTAILVDGGYYRKRAIKLWGTKTPAQRVGELLAYCNFHIIEPEEPRELYRIFYYDCPPMRRTMKNPITEEIIDFSEGTATKWSIDFYDELSTKVKVVLRMGELAENVANYVLKPESLNELLKKTKTVDDLSLADFNLDVKQKGVDMRIGLDASSISLSRFVDQIILIAGDSDFLPVAKMVRRNGVEFILDPMKQSPKKSLLTHVDRIETYVDRMYVPKE